ncbi:hypothetical protein [Mycolicibacterium fortuitum]|nr:hypothetical protein [Mycolicibacterium fortuitum]
MDDRERWVERYGADYDTDEAREAAYRDYLRNRADVMKAFGIEQP